MITAKKVRLIPATEQEQQLWKSAGTSRFVYNWELDKQIRHMKKIGKLNKISDNVLRKGLTLLKQTDEYEWLYEVSNIVAKQAVKNVCEAIDRFHSGSKKHGYKYRQSAVKSGKKPAFTDFEDFPRFKSRRRSKVPFYDDTDKLKVYTTEVHIEKAGKMKLAEHDRIPVGEKYTKPRVTRGGKYWYISAGIGQDTANPELTGETIGIDLGIKELAAVSNMDEPIENINRTKEVGQLRKKLKRKQMQISRNMIRNI